ncbi:MAG: hypothetical protein AB7Y46_15560, partial [Armatimonadota bacterium]
RSFFFGWRYVRKYYAGALAAEIAAWTRKLEDFWGLVFSSWRTADEALSQHAVGGSLLCLLDVAFMQPDWASEFFASGYDRMMGEKAIACCNNMGQMVMLGDTNPTDYPSVIFAKLAWRHRDGRYQHMIQARGATRVTGDEAMRAFAAGVEPEIPSDHIGLRIFPIDELYFTLIRSHEGVDAGNGFDKITFREGFDPAAEYMLVDGVSGGGHAYEDANTIGEFSAHGRRWLIEFDRFNGACASFHNAVTVARDGLGAPEIPYAAELLSHGSGEGWAYTATRLPHYNGVGWTRHIAWFPGAYTFVLDELSAEQAGEYSFVLGWRSVGYPALEPGRFTAAQDEPDAGLLSFEGRALADAVVATGGEALYHDGLTGALYYRAAAEGDFVEMALTIPESGRYEVLVTPQRHPLRGVAQLAIDGSDVGAPVALYGPESTGDEPVMVGTAQLAEGRHTVRLTAVAPNEAGETYFMAIRRLAFRAGEASAARLRAARNRFALSFPAQVHATLDRDTEVLGPGLPQEPWRDQAINVLEQSMSRALQPGDSACFQNAFAAMAGDEVAELEVRRVAERAALVRRGNEVELVAVALTEPLHLGELTVAGRMARIGPLVVVLHEARARLAGRPLASGAPPDAGALRALLGDAWEAASAEAVAGAPTLWIELPRLTQVWSARVPSRPLSLVALGAEVAVGTEEGVVQVLDARGALRGQFSAGGPVHALAAGDLDADGISELLVGSDDEHVYALNADLSERWRCKLPFLGTQTLFWSLYSSKVRALLAEDLDADGRPEIYAGAGDMHVHALSPAGELLWGYQGEPGVPSTLRGGSLGGGRLLLAGSGLTSYSGASWALNVAGELIHYWRGLKSAAVQDIAAADLDGDGAPAVFVGTARGDLYAWATDAQSPDWSWVRNFTRPVRALTVLPTQPGLIAVGADSGSLSAFDEAGAMAWHLPLSAAVTHTALVRRGGEVLLAAGCKSGAVFLVSLEGALRSWFDAGGKLQAMAVADLEGDGTDEIAITTAQPDRALTLALD